MAGLLDYLNTGADALTGSTGNYGGLLTDEDQKAAQAQARMALAAQLLNAGGWSPERTNLGQALGRGMAAAGQARQSSVDQALQAALLRKQLQGPSGPQGVQSTVIGDDGYYYTIDRLTGKFTKSDVKAAPNMRVLEQEGQPPIGVTIGRGPAGQVTPISAPRIPTSAEKARDEARAKADVELATRPDITRETELAKIDADRSASLPKQLADIQKMRSNIEGLLESPGFNAIYGKSRYLSPSMLPGGEGANSDARREQIEAQTFGESIQSMKGMGALSNAEGLKVTAAYSRATNPKISEDEARKAWGEVLDQLTIAEERLRNGVRVSDTPASSPKRVKVDAQGNVIK